MFHEYDISYIGYTDNNGIFNTDYIKMKSNYEQSINNRSSAVIQLLDISTQMNTKSLELNRDDNKTSTKICDLIWLLTREVRMRDNRVVKQFLEKSKSVVSVSEIVILQFNSSIYNRTTTLTATEDILEITNNKNPQDWKLWYNKSGDNYHYIYVNEDKLYSASDTTSTNKIKYTIKQSLRRSSNFFKYTFWFGCNFF